KVWEARIEEGTGAEERKAALSAICRGMVERRRMMESATELSLGTAERKAIPELRSRGIFQSPTISQGTRVGEDEIRFTHHLLHDYAIARSVIPSTGVPFCDFALNNRLLPIFYRQSFVFALEEVWDSDRQRATFWDSAMKLESASKLNGITGVIAPVLAARRVETISDLHPLLPALAAARDTESSALEALLH